jgi:hypothetical protein
MLRLLAVIGLLLPRASARNIDQLGEGTPGIDAMWAVIRSVFPYTGVGEGGLTLLLLKVTNFILIFIGGIAVAMIIYAGIKIVTGGEEGIGEAKKIILYAAGGLIAALVADAVVIYVMVLVNAASA